MLAPPFKNSTVPSATPSPMTLVTSSSAPPFKEVTTPGGVLTNETLLSPPVGVLNVRESRPSEANRDVDGADHAVAGNARNYGRRVERHEVLVGDVGRLEGRRRGRRRVGEFDRVWKPTTIGPSVAAND